MLLPLWRLAGLRDQSRQTSRPSSCRRRSLPPRSCSSCPGGTCSRCRCSCSCTSWSRSPRSSGAWRVSSAGSRVSGISNPHRDWIDRAVPAGAEVSVLWTGEGDIYTVWQNEFFSRSVGTIYSIAGQLLGALPQTTLSVDARAGLLRGPDGRPVRPRYLLVDDTFTPPGACSPATRCVRITLYELDGPLRSADEGDRALRRHMVGRPGHLHAPRLRGRLRRPRAAARRSEPLHRAADRCRPDRRRGRRPRDVQAGRGEGARRPAPTGRGRAASSSSPSPRRACRPS